uniref:Uncharacterized protein n=1 Tax=Caldisericum exile TaxID=693075 RepID=A0A7C4Y4L2_9BACT
MPYIDDKSYEPEISSSNFMKLQPGENKIRIASRTFHFKKHGFRSEGKYSSKICQGENCPYCQQGNEPKNRYAWIVIDRKEQDPEKMVKVLEVGWQIYSQLLAYAKDEDYGELTKYDVKIKRTGEGLETEYSVVASPKKSEITEEEKQAIEESNIDLEKLFSGGKFAKVEEPPVEVYEEEVAEERVKQVVDEIPF